MKLRVIRNFISRDTGKTYYLEGTVFETEDAKRFLDAGVAEEVKDQKAATEEKTENKNSGVFFKN